LDLEVVMAVRTTAAFLTGLATGWVMRSALGSSRDVLVRGIVATHHGRAQVRRLIAERIEWLDDLFAEGRARYEEAAETAPLDDKAPPHVGRTDHRERAA
jgi:hypothetical protein